MEADRARARIAYANGVTDAAIAKQKRTPEYRAANAEFRRLDAELAHSDGPQDLANLLKVGRTI